MSEEANYIYRPGTKSDINFIMSSWVHSQRNADYNNFIDNEFYYSWQFTRVVSLINRSNIIMISDPEDSNHIFGYVVFQNIDDLLVVHFLYIKLPFRKMGLAKSLLKYICPNLGEVPIILTHIDQTKYYVIKNRNFPKTSSQEYIAKQTSCFILTRRKYGLQYNPTIIKESNG